MVGVQREEEVERAGDLGRRLVLAVGHREHHVQEILDVLEVITRVDDRLAHACLLYTSDAADERSSVDLGGGRIIKKKKEQKKKKKAVKEIIHRKTSE